MKQLWKQLIATCLLLVSTITHAGWTVRYQHTDSLGSVIAQSNDQGTISQRFDYKPFGEGSPTQKSGLGYTGHLEDTDLGLTYMQQRYYDPVIGRFYSNDPVDAVAHLHGTNGTYGFNRYAYANNNPYKFTDPDGRSSEEIKQGLAEAFGFEDSATADAAVKDATSPYPSSGTVEYGGAATVSVLGSATVSVTVAMDSNKNVAVNVTGGVGLGGLGASVELVRTTTSAQNVSDLAGAGAVATIGAGEGLGGSGSYVEGTGYTGTSVGLGATIGIGPVSGSAHKTYTVQPFN